MTHFASFSQVINHRLIALQKTGLVLEADCEGDELYTAYLAAFPEGTDPIFQERTEHDCSCCKHFIRTIGKLVVLKEGKIETVWGDGEDYPFPYNVVAQALNSYVIASGVRTIFRAPQASYGLKSNVGQLKDGSVKTFEHFHGTLSTSLVAKDQLDVGRYNTARQVLASAAQLLTLSALDTVLDLINSNAIYRGSEHKYKVTEFKTFLQRYTALASNTVQQQYHVLVSAANPLLANFKNSVIGTLVEDISTGVDLDKAVRSFETKVAPANYQRTSQIITQKMIDDALKAINELGVPVSRRMAKLDDVSINNVLWASGKSKPLMKDGLAGLLSGAVTAKPVDASKNITDVTIDNFMSDILPKAVSMRVLVKRELANNFMTLTTSDEEGTNPLFKWGNNFAWSYAGNVTDMITERVKAAGGNVNALLRFSLSWHNQDDLDLHVRVTLESGYKEHIYFGRKVLDLAGLKGDLDVDMNVFNISPDPVENIAFTKLPPGKYEVEVNNFRRRGGGAAGFVLQAATPDSMVNYTSAEALAHGNTVKVVTAVVAKDGSVTYGPSALASSSQQTTAQAKWGVQLDQFANVSTVMFSPNYWDDNAVGNKHWFFIIDGAKCDEEPRGIYNEYLAGNLMPYRKVMDVLGERTKCPITDDQLTGIGISSTLDKKVVVEVTTNDSKRQYQISF